MQAHQLCGQSADRRGRTGFPGKLHCGIQIFQQRAHVPLHRLETAFGHLRGEDLQRSGIGKATGQRFGDQTGIDPGLFGQRHHFGDHQSIAGDDHLIAGLGHLTGADTAHVCDALPEGEQNRAYAIKIRFISADHDRQTAGLGPGHSARHRRIEPGHACLAGQLGCHLTGGSGFEAGKIHQQLTGFRPFSHAGRAEHHLAHHRRVRQTEHHHVGVPAQFGRGCDLPGTRLDQRRALGRVAVPHGQRITGGQQTPAHRQAHQPDSGKPQRRSR